MIARDAGVRGRRSTRRRAIDSSVVRATTVARVDVTRRRRRGRRPICPDFEGWRDRRVMTRRESLVMSSEPSRVPRALRSVSTRSRPQSASRAMSLTTARAHYQEDIARGEECDNCGHASGALACCSRCHSAWFCSVACQRAYWPFHKQWCKRNDFADAVEASEPKFARWMRKHGKQAVLKDGAWSRCGAAC